MRVTSGLPLAAAVVLSCFAAADRPAAETWPGKVQRAGFETAGPLYTYGPPDTYQPPYGYRPPYTYRSPYPYRPSYRYAPYDQRRPGWGWRAYDTRNRGFYSRPWWPDLWSYRANDPYRRYDSGWAPRWGQPTWRGYGPRAWDWRPY
jgi:hypothetical protein